MKALITGAGIGGLTTAIALQKKGIPYEIFDAAPACREVGAGILLGANAMTVYEKLELAALLRERSVFLSRLYIRDHKGNILKTIDNEMLRRRYGNGAQAIHRAVLQQSLINAVQQPVQWGKRCVQVQQDESGVTALFEDGTAARGDLLIGADGIRSAVREQQVARAVYRYSGQTCWRAIIPCNLPPAERAESSEVWGPGNGIRASYIQVGPEQVYFWCTKRMPAGSRFTPAAALAFIRQELAPFRRYMQTMLQQITPDTLIHSDLYDIAPLDNWYKGRVVLLGDAAHATTPNLGQGASQAIEDAWMLAACLAGAPDLTTAFNRYQQRRIKRARWVVRTSRQLAQFTNLQGHLAVWLRNLLMKNVPTRLSDRQMDMLYNVQLDE